jgi:hypothetical protein
LGITVNEVRRRIKHGTSTGLKTADLAPLIDLLDRRVQELQQLTGTATAWQFWTW